VRHLRSRVLVIVFALGGSAYALQQSLKRAIAVNLVPQDLRSTGFGVLTTIKGIRDATQPTTDWQCRRTPSRQLSSSTFSNRKLAIRSHERRVAHL
jgi:hypothetical protein